MDGDQEGPRRLPVDLPPRLRPRLPPARITTALGEPDRNAAAVLSMAAAVRRRRGRRRGVPGAHAVGLLLGGHRPAGPAARRRRGRAGDRSSTARRSSLPVLVVGAPLRFRHRVYNTAAVVHRGRLLGVVPKSYLPTYREFYERRQLAPGDDLRTTIRVGRDLPDVPFGPDLLFCAEDVPGLVLHVEICEDMWVPIPPSAEAALAGATVLANLSGSPITIGRAEDRHLLCRSASSRCLAAYLYAAAGVGESSTDLAWDGQTMIYENGVLLAETPRFPTGPAARRRRHRPRPAARRTGPHGHVRRQPPPPRPRRRVPHDRLPRRSADAATSGSGAPSNGSRSCPATTTASPRTATRRTTSRCRDSSNGSAPSATRTSSSACPAASTRPTP